VCCWWVEAPVRQFVVCRRGLCSSGSVGLVRKKLIQIILKNGVHTAKKTIQFCIINISWLILFKKIIVAVYCESYT
jgi:hypothetical protein